MNINIEQLKEIASAVMFAVEGQNLDEVLERIAHVSRELVKARYAALGVPDGSGGLQYFKVSGMTSEEVQHVGHLPSGKGLLGVIMREQQSLRLERMEDDERSARFCANHPAMTSLLGVPIQIGAQLFGILYLCDREDGELFSEQDQWLIETVAGYAALAIAGSELREQQNRVALMEERERIGMELHDGVIQSLYAIGMQLELLDSHEDEPGAALNQVMGELNSVIEDIRSYILNLKGSHYRQKSMYAVLQEVVGRLHVPNEIAVILDVPDKQPPVTPSVFEAVCQMVNEALSNAVRHANASNIHVACVDDQQHFRVTITDDGNGFDLNVLASYSGLGLRNIQARARLHNGEVKIVTAHNEGTSLTVTVPISAPV